MLALSRKKSEALIINNNIEITVLEIKGDQRTERSARIPERGLYADSGFQSGSDKYGRAGSFAEFAEVGMES